MTLSPAQQPNPDASTDVIVHNRISEVRVILDLGRGRCTGAGCSKRTSARLKLEIFFLGQPLYVHPL
jgi:hypothetical protein